MDIDKIIDTASYIKRRKYRAKLKDFFLILNVQGYDDTFYHVFSLLKSSNPNFLDAIINLKNDEDNHSKLIDLLQTAYLKAIESDAVTYKKIKKIRRALYEFAVKHNIELQSLLNVGQESLSYKAKRIEKHKNTYKRPEDNTDPAWLELNKMAQELGLLPNEDQLFNENNPSPISLKTAMERYLAGMQVKVKEKSKDISLKQIEDLQSLFIKTYHNNKLTQNLLIISEIVKEKQQEEKGPDHYNEAFDKVKATLTAAVVGRIVFMSLDVTEEINETRLKIISKQHNHNPILILQGERFFIYGRTKKQDWELKELDPKAFKDLEDQSPEGSKSHKYFGDVDVDELPDDLRPHDKYKSLRELAKAGPKILKREKITRKMRREIKKGHVSNSKATRTTLRFHSPKFFSETPIFWQKELDYDFFSIIDILANLGLHKEVAGLKAVIENLSEESPGKDKLAYLLDIMYAMFNSLSVLEDEEQNRLVPDNTLKLLKKHIHSFAEKHHFDKKIFNLETLYRKNKRGDETLNRASKREDTDQIISDQLLNTPNRKFAYIDNLAQEMTQRKLEVRKHKKRLDMISLISTSLVGISEGATAAAFLLSVTGVAAVLGGFFFPIIALVGIAGLAVNVYLFRRDSYSTLKEFLFGIFKDEKGYEVSTIKKAGIVLTLMTVVPASLVFSVFAFSSVLALIAFPPVGIPLAIGFAVAMLIVNTGVFYAIMADFIKNDRIKQIGQYFKRDFYDAFKHPNWNSLSLAGKIVHVALICPVKFIFKAGFLLGTLALCGFITVVTAGMGYSHSLKLLAAYTSLAPKIMNIMAAVAVFGLAAPANIFFYWKGVLSVMVNGIKSGIESLVAGTIKNFGHIGKNIKNSWKEFNENPIRRVNVVISSVKNVLLGGAAVINGYLGQGAAAFEKIPLMFVQKTASAITTLNVSRFVSQLIGWLSLGTGSFSVNTKNIVAANKVEDAINVKPQVQVVPKKNDVEKVSAKPVKGLEKAEPRVERKTEKLLTEPIKGADKTEPKVPKIKPGKVANDAAFAYNFLKELRGARKKTDNIRNGRFDEILNEALHNKSRNNHKS